MSASLLGGRKAILNAAERLTLRWAKYAHTNMPELPEVEITARLVDGATAGARIESALAPGVNALKTYDPALSALDGRSIERVRRRGKLFLVEVEDGLTILIHLMSAGRLQLFDTRASLRDRASRLLGRLDCCRELRLRDV